MDAGLLGIALPPNSIPAALAIFAPPVIRVVPAAPEAASAIASPLIRESAACCR